ncbi:MAG: GIY-YIG nuclease family protein [Allosphingosinicella sp.]
MTDPSTQHLYIVQNEFGLIKVGRSVDVAGRIRSLQSTDRCRIHIVETFRECGDMEESLHIDLAEYGLFGEWFEGTRRARAALAGLLGIEDIRWPVAYDKKAAARWIAHMEKVRLARARRRAIYRVLTFLRQAKAPHYRLDADVFDIWVEATCGERPFIVLGNRGEGPRARYLDHESGTLAAIPPYSADPLAALEIWPAPARPSSWQGSALQCCIAGLEALRAAIREPPRPPGF